MSSKKITWCKNCLNMSTRPRITFDHRGWCNACQWMEEKEKIDWSSRDKELEKLLKKHRSKDGTFDCITTVSGGKDGSYVSYVLKHKYNMNPLAITIRPALAMEIGDQNLLNFIQSGYDHVHLSPNTKVLDRLNKYGFIEKGFPYYGWLIAIMSAVIKTASSFKIPLIFYGEDGEVEYGGSSESKNKSLYDISYMKRVYLEGGHEKVLDRIRQDEDISEAELSFFKFPSDEEVSEVGLSFTHMSYYEPWDSYRNYVVAKEHCGLIEKEEGNDDTFTNFSQNDQALYTLHAYLMYLKFGFGRIHDYVNEEIWDGLITREEGILLLQKYDGCFDTKYVINFCEYLEISLEDFWNVVDSYVNKELFEKTSMGIYKRKFLIGKGL